MGSLADVVKRQRIIAKNGGLNHKPKSTISGRRYTLVGHRPNAEDIVRQNVSANAIKRVKQYMKLEGCSTFDQIETRSLVEMPDGSKRLLQFHNKSYTPALEGSIPGNSLASVIKIQNDRIAMRQKNDVIRARNNKPIVSRPTTKITIWKKETGKVMFHGTEDEAARFIVDRDLDLSTVVIDMPEKLYKKIEKMEEIQND